MAGYPIGFHCQRETFENATGWTRRRRLSCFTSPKKIASGSKGNANRRYGRTGDQAHLCWPASDGGRRSLSIRTVAPAIEASVIFGAMSRSNSETATSSVGRRVSLSGQTSRSHSSGGDDERALSLPRAKSDGCGVRECDCVEHLVLCENSAEVGSPDNWRIDAAGGGRVHPEIRPNRHRCPTKNSVGPMRSLGRPAIKVFPTRRSRVRRARVGTAADSRDAQRADVR